MVDLLGLVKLPIEIKVEGRNSFRKQKTLNFLEKRPYLFRVKMVVFAWFSTQKRRPKERGEPHPPLMFTVLLRGLGPFFTCMNPVQRDVRFLYKFIKFAYNLLHHVSTICTCLFFVKTYAYCIHIFAHHCLTHASLYVDKLGCFNNAYIMHTWHLMLPK